MLIPVNQNIDEYKDDFYKGLTLRQSVISLITIAVGAVVYLTLTGVLHLPQSLALYLTLPVVFPIAAYGFLKIHGMNIAEYVRKRGAVKERSSYAFIPQMFYHLGEDFQQGFSVTDLKGARDWLDYLAPRHLKYYQDEYGSLDGKTLQMLLDIVNQDSCV